MSSHQVFVIMPFAEEFSDVYLVLRDCMRSPELTTYSMLRADEIATPGRITDQILDSIQEADIVIADISNNNPNVMFELGYARALQKPTIILNQNVAAAPFDIAELRQIVYDRQRLVGDLRPQITTALRATAAMLMINSSKGQTAEIALLSSTSSESMGTALVPQAQSLNEADTRPLLSPEELVNRLSVLEIEVQLASESSDVQRVASVAQEAKGLIDTVTLTGASKQSLDRLAGQIGDLAVEFHNAKLYREAEDLFNRALKVDDNHTGVFIQYALYFALHKRDFTRAEELISRAERMGGSVTRIASARSKISVLKAHDSPGEVSPALLDDLRQRWEGNLGNVDACMSYLLMLDRLGRQDEAIDQYRRRAADLPPIATNTGYKLHRGFADAVAGDDIPEHEIFCRGIYENLLQHHPKDHQVLSNLAVLRLHGDAESKRLGLTHYLAAYSVSRTETQTRRGFSQAVRSLVGRLDIAAKIARGDPLDDSDARAITLATFED